MPVKDNQTPGKKKFSFDAEASFEGSFEQLPKRDPGHYVVNVVGLTKGKKYKTKVGDEIIYDPTINVDYLIVGARKIYDNTIDKETLKGKHHVHQIKIDELTDKKFMNIHTRVGHNLNKLGITKEAINAVAEEFGGPDTMDDYIREMNNLLTDAAKKAKMELLINASVYQGRWFCDVPANPVFAAEFNGDLPVSADQHKLNFQYHAQLQNTIPSSGGDAPSGSAPEAGGDSF